MSVSSAEHLDLIIDASVGVKWLVQESYSNEAARLLSPEVRMHVPALFFTEVSQTIWKKVHIRNEVSADAGRELVERLMILPLARHPIDFLISAAFEIALQTRRTVYDSIYLALAQSTGLRLVTADERLFNARKGQPLDLAMIWVADIPALFDEDSSKNGDGRNPDV